MAGFWLWQGCTLLFVVLGIYSLLAKKPVQFWANFKGATIREDEVLPYNRACGKMRIVFAAAWAILGFPLRAGQNSALVLLSVLGSFFAIIGLILAYMQIENKYRK